VVYASSKMTPNTVLNRRRGLTLVAAIGLLAGFVANWNSSRDGVDFPSLYVMGEGIATGTNIYASAVADTFPQLYGVMRPAGMFYPPATGFAMAPFALLPYELGKVLWFLAIELTLIFGVRRMVQIAAPLAEPYVWMSAVALVLFSSSVRWGLILLQGAPLALGLLCWLVVAMHSNRPRLAVAVAVVATAAKMTLALPFVALLLLQRRFVAAFAGVAAWALLNALGFIRMGGLSTFKDYQQNIGLLEAFGDINSPDPWALETRPRLDWTTLFYGLTGNLTVSRGVSLVLTASASLWLLRQGLRTRPPITLPLTTLFLAPLICLGSLCVYHHHYDASLFLVPALLGYFVLEFRTQPKWALWLHAPLLAIIVLLPIGLVQTMAQAALGDLGVGLLKLAFPAAFSLALAGSLVLLSRATATKV